MKQLFIAMAIVLSMATHTTYSQNINSKASEVVFSISNMKFKTVEGTFSGMMGKINFDANNLETSSMNVCISSASVNTGNKKRDKHLRNEDYFETDKYPEICFTSNKIVKSSNGFIAVGELHLHGVNKPVEIPFLYEEKTFTGSFTIKRKDFEVGGKGTFMVGDEVTLNIVCKLN